MFSRVCAAATHSSCLSSLEHNGVESETLVRDGNDNFCLNILTVLLMVFGRIFALTLNSYHFRILVQEKERGEEGPEMEPFLKRNVNSLGRRTNYTLNLKAERGKLPRRCRNEVLSGIKVLEG